MTIYEHKLTDKQTIGEEIQVTTKSIVKLPPTIP